MNSQEFARGGKKPVLLSQEFQPHESFRAHRKRRHFLYGLVLVLFLAAWYNFDNISKLRQQPEIQYPNNDHSAKMVDPFADITPSEKLEWHPCFYNIFCARLTVPMDYHRPLNESKDHPKVHIGLVMVPGKHPIWERQSKSPLLINPGGPGGSGTMAAMAFGPYIQKIVGEDQDVVGFDPRGIATTTPQADCYSRGGDQARGLFHRLMWQLQGAGIGLVNSSSDSLAKIDTRARALAKLCEDKDALHGKDSILRYMHTPSVARDMISIIDAWDEWVENQNKESADQVEMEAEPSNDHRCDAELSDTKGKLVYWGFSYGTLLGATFASMFPDRVGRVVLDGVVHADHYVGPVWEGSIQDTDAIFGKFSTYCHEAKSVCAMYREGDTPEDIASRFQAVMDRIKQNPLTFSSKLSNAPMVVTYSDLKHLIFSTLYNPNTLWAPVATIFNLLSEGHDEVLQNLFVLPELPTFCGNVLPYWAYPGEAQDAIMCSDKRYPLNETLPNLEERFEHMANYSSFADVWMGLMVGCDGWGIKAIDPPMRWDDHPAHKQKPINTSFPVLFVSNTLDPVTPLSAGVAMARKFVDAGLVEQKSEGHCSLAAVSKCTISKLRAYFLLGKVPPHPSTLKEHEWEQCEADEWPFHPYNGDPFTARSEEARLETERMIAFKEMQSVSQKVMRFWGQKDSQWNMPMIEDLGRREDVDLPRFV